MPIHDPRGVLLHRLDHYVDDFVATAGRRRTHLAVEIATLNELADALAGSLATWEPMVARLTATSRPAFDARRVGALVIECALEAMLEPCACQVLTAAFDLAISPR